MFKIRIFTFLILLLTVNAFAQNSYYYSQTRSIPPINIAAETIDLQYPINMENIKAIGMGNTQTANGKTFNAMMYNPAFLGRHKKTFEVFGLGASMPPDTYDAAWFLEKNMDEFNEAISLDQLWDGVNKFFAQGASLEDRLVALNEIQEGMKFTLDLVSEITGSAEDPQIHGISVLPSISVQHGHWGFSLYGFGYSGFVVELSPTLETLSEIEIPENMDNPVLSAKSAAKIMATLATDFLSGGETFSDEIFPIAYYMSYIDIIGAFGYGFQWKDNWMFGANLKVVNRRFITDRIAVIDYDQILNDAWDNLKSDVTGITFDVGGLYQSSFGTSFGLSLQNIIPLQTIKKSINTEFKFPKLFFDRDENNQIITNAEGDTAIASSVREVTVNRPFELKCPFIVNIGVCHPITPNFDVALDWVDIAEQDSRYERIAERIRLGTEYRLKTWKDRLMFAFRVGMADERLTLGLGLNITKYFQIDGAYAYDRFVEAPSYFGQIKIGW